MTKVISIFVTFFVCGKSQVGKNKFRLLLAIFNKRYQLYWIRSTHTQIRWLRYSKKNHLFLFVVTLRYPLNLYIQINFEQNRGKRGENKKEIQIYSVDSLVLFIFTTSYIRHVVIDYWLPWVGEVISNRHQHGIRFRPVHSPSFYGHFIRLNC